MRAIGERTTVVILYGLRLLRDAASLSTNSLPPPRVLANLLAGAPQSPGDSAPALIMPCCYDGLTARLVARAGFPLTFMTGFGVSASRGFPDAGLISFEEMRSSASAVAEGLSGAAAPGTAPIPCIADGDTGYGNAVNAKRTVAGYARAGMAGVMIEDQVSPKRCGHVGGKSVVGRAEAVARVKAACDARDEYAENYGQGTGPLVLARTDALVGLGFEEAVERCVAFREAGADMTFLEAPTTIREMREYCEAVDGPKLANMLEGGSTPVLTPHELGEMGYTMAAYPLTLLSASIKAMENVLEKIRDGKTTDDLIKTFEETKDVVGFTSYGEEEMKYRS